MAAAAMMMATAAMAEKAFEITNKAITETQKPHEH